MFDELFGNGQDRIEQFVVYAQNQPVGVLAPSVMFGTCVTGELVVSGPKGISLVEEWQFEGVIKALVSVGGILFGDSEEVSEVVHLLEDDKASRSVSYLLCISKNCSELLEANERINNACVLIAGSGGIGSLSAVMLAGLGVGRIKVVDPDLIERSNLNRQFLWKESDVGRSKVEVLKEYLEARYEIKCDVYNDALTGQNVWEFGKNIDGVILSADEPVGVAQEEFRSIAHSDGLNVVITGYSHQHSIVRFEPSKSSSSGEDYYFNLQGRAPIKWHRHKYFIGPSFGPMNSQIAGLASTLITHSVAFPRLKEEISANGGMYVWNPEFA